MKIYFITLKGFDPKLGWDYDEKTDRATCSPPKQNPAFEMPAGMTIEGNLLVIDKVSSFKMKYPFKKEASTPEFLKIFNEDTFFAPKKSDSFTALKTFPKSILLTSLIPEDADPHIIRATLAYRRIHELQKNKPEERFLKNTTSLFKPTTLTNQLQVELLAIIEESLVIFNDSYVSFCQKNLLSTEVGHEICEYFRQAIMQTMTNKELRNAPSEFQKIQVETLFYTNLESHAHFCNQSQQLKLQALTLNWQALVDDKLDIKFSTASCMSQDLQKALKYFKAQLHPKDKLASFLEKMGEILVKLGIEEQRLDSLYKCNLTTFNNYFSLRHLVCEQLNTVNIKKMPYDFHIILPPKIAADILSCLLNQLSKSIEFNKSEYASLMSKFNNTDADIFISSDWIGEIQEKCRQIVESKKFPKEITLTCSSQIVASVQQGIFECLQALLRFNLPHRIESYESYSPIPSMNR